MTLLLLVMKQAGNIRVMKRVLAAEGFSVLEIRDEREVEAALSGPSTGAIGLVDVADYGPDVWRICQVLHSRHVRFLVLSASHQGEAERAVGHGASALLQKPVGRSALVQLLKTLAAAQSVRPGDSHGGHI